MKRICEFCNKEYEWIEGQSNWGKIGLKNGKGSVNSKKYCCYECGKKAYKENCKKTNLERYGVENPFQAEQFKEKSKQTLLEKYGVDNSMKLKETQEKAQATCLSHYGKKFSAQVKECQNKRKKTNLKKYGYESPTQNIEIKNKTKRTLLERYGNENYNNLEKASKTMLERYGKQFYTQTEEYKDKTKNTCLEKYGVEYSFQSENNKKKSKQTLLNKYGVENYSQTEEFKEKTKKTLLEKYGVETPFSSSEIKEKIRETMKQKYGFDYFVLTEEFKEKSHISKKERGTYGKSKEEDVIYDLLLNKFNKVERQYKSDLYPFNCDFYIPEKDLYIEYQGAWTHGQMIFNESNILCQEKLKLWLERINNKDYPEKRKKYYRNALRIWVITDPLKREIAKKNHLNWIEFWTVEEAKKWIEENL